MRERERQADFPVRMHNTEVIAFEFEAAITKIRRVTGYISKTLTELWGLHTQEPTSFHSVSNRIALRSYTIAITVTQVQQKRC